jgi:hypothetical protein
MQKQNKRLIIPVLALVFLMQQTCGDNDQLLFLRFQCAMKGGTWNQEMAEDGEVYWKCEEPVAPPEKTCYASPTEYTWSYEDFNSSSGTGGVACHARFLFKNISNEHMYLILHTSWDNNAMSDSGWHSYSVMLDSEWEMPVSRTIYTDGVITYDRVDRLLVIRDTPECMDLALNQEATWEEKAIFIDYIPCP